MRTRALAAVVLSLLALLALLARPAATGRAVRADRPDGASGSGRVPNLVILVGDDHAGGTLGLDGDPRRATPRLDALAAGGVRFDRAYCNAPVCTASRQSFLTGKYPHAIGVTRLMTPLPVETTTLGDWLSGLGYRTAALGKMHFNNDSRHGFGTRVDSPDWKRWLFFHPPEGGDRRRPWKPFEEPAARWLNADALDYGLPAEAMEDRYLADRAASYIADHRHHPFAMIVGFHAPHSPFLFPRDAQVRFRAEQFTAPPVTEADRRAQPLVFRDLTEGQIRGVQAAYFTSLAFLDEQVGRVLDAIDRAGLGPDTIVVYLGDNGYLLGEHGRFEKHCMYEPAVRVPLVVRWPGHLREGAAVGDLVELVDVFPTLLDLAGLPQPPGLHGRSLAPLLRGEPGASGRDVVFSEYLEDEEAMVRSARYKLVVGTGSRRRRDGYASAEPARGPYERLFDLVTDPEELIDRSGDPALSDVAEALRDRLHERLVSTRGAGRPVPSGLSRRAAIAWCLQPPDGPGAGP
jgi:choline-sulfatase